MDGLLINSEPFWQQAEIEIFGKLGINLTPELAVKTIGMRLDRVVEHYFDRYPWNGPSTEDVTQELLDRVTELVRTKGLAQPGVYDVLDLVDKHNVRVGLATSSDPQLIDAVLDRLDIRDHFEVICSAMDEENGKPHPAVFLTTARALNVAPQKCLVLEDSLRGVIAAKAAEMTCVVVPDHSLRDDPRLAIADRVLQSLADFDETVWDQLQSCTPP